MAKKILKVKSWKERNGKFEFGVGAIIRKRDNKLFYLNYAYNAEGYVPGTTVEIQKAYDDKIHVDVEFISAKDEHITTLKEVDVDRLWKIGNWIYVNAEPDCTN